MLTISVLSGPITLATCKPHWSYKSAHVPLSLPGVYFVAGEVIFFEFLEAIRKEVLETKNILFLWEAVILTV